MSWEAFRLTSKSPSELLAVMGPAGVDGMVRDALMSCWRSLPEETRSMETWRERVNKLWTRNMRVWTAIKKPTPDAFFNDLAPYESDGHFRQALVMTWMMLPRSGGRDFKSTFKVIRDIFDRNVSSWESDFVTFTGSPKKSQKAAKNAKGAKGSKKVVAAKPSKRSAKKPKKRAAKKKR